MSCQEITSPCGLGCFNRPPHPAVEHERLRNQHAARLNILPAQAQCAGWRPGSAEVEAIGRREPCYIYSCIPAQNINFCFECHDFPVTAGTPMPAGRIRGSLTAKRLTCAS